MNRHNLPLARHAAMDMSAIGWGNDGKQFKPSHKPRMAAWPQLRRVTIGL